jgi:hypothetical protein
MASAIGGYLVDMGDPILAQRYFQHARKAGHDARNPACAAYAAANTTLAAFLRGDVPTALDNAAAARTNDPRLQALAEQMAAAAYALDGQHDPCMAASARAHDLLTTANGSAPESLAYWMHHGTIDSQRSLSCAYSTNPATLWTPPAPHGHNSTVPLWAATDVAKYDWATPSYSTKTSPKPPGYSAMPPATPTSHHEH